MRPRDVALACAELDRLVLDEVTDVDDALLHERPRPVAPILRQPRGPVDGRCDVAALRAELALAAAPEVPHDLLRALDLLRLLRLLRLLLVDARERALHGLARLEVAAAEPEARDAV